MARRGARGKGWIRLMRIIVWVLAVLIFLGGIILGMSGSPIVQNGKIIGAVTHVVTDAPTQGYAVFIEYMLAHTRSS